MSAIARHYQDQSTLNSIVLSDFFRDQLTKAPKKQRDKQQTGYSKHLGWVFLTNNPSHKPKSVRTYRSLTTAAGDYTYFTPNTFYRSDCREQGSLRWINAVSVDFDVKDPDNVVTFPELIDVIEVTGLSLPSLVIQTPSGGYHLHWYLKEPRRAYMPVIEQYKRIVRLMIEEIGADLQANGPERYFRMPTADNVVYQSTDRVSFDDLCDWYSIEVDRRQEETFNAFVKPGFNLLAHPAIRKLLEGVEEGNRDNVCYTLALAYKSTGIDAAATERKLQKWNKKNTPPLPQIDVKRKVKSAFKPGAPKGASAYHIGSYSGLPFTYQVWEAAKDRTERTYSHYNEWEEDVLAHIRYRGGSLCGAQRMLAKEIRSSANANQTISYATFKKVTAQLVDAGELVKTVEGRGRGAITTLSIQVQANAVEMESVASEGLLEPTPNGNGLNSYTPRDTVVGGIALEPERSTQARPLDTSSSFSPVPGNVPDRFVSALFNRGFRDGRFIFSAWGKVQLGFKANGIRFKDIAKNPDYLTLTADAVGIAVEVKGDNRDGAFTNSDGFLRYLYGTVKGLVANFLAMELEQFIDHVKSVPDKELESMRMDYHTELFFGIKSGDRERRVRSFMAEIDRERAARKRRAEPSPFPFLDNLWRD